MAKIRIFLAEIVAMPLVLAWLFLKYPDAFDAIAPWAILIVMWHLTLIIGEIGFVKSKVELLHKRSGNPPMTWLIVFCFGGLVSVGYWYSIRHGLAKLDALKIGPSPVSPAPVVKPYIEPPPKHPAGFEENSETPYVITCAGSEFTVWPSNWGPKVTILTMNEVPLIEAYRSGDRIAIDAQVWAGGDQWVRVVDRKIENNRFGWDTNYNESAMEVVNEQGMPVLQIINESKHKAEIYGLFQGKGVFVVVTRKQMGMSTNPPDVNKVPGYPLKRIFLYPSRKHLGQEVED